MRAVRRGGPSRADQSPSKAYLQRTFSLPLSLASLETDVPWMSSTGLMSSEALSALDALVQSEKRQRAEASAAKERHEVARRDMEELQDLLALSRSRRPYSCEERVSIPVVAGTCAGVICGRKCAGMLAARATRLGVVVCHPFGPLGGSMYDPHVLAIVKSLRHVTTLRLNFRTGLDCGYSASNDVKAACKYLLHSIESPPERLLLVGYSYGALVVADAAPSIAECGAFALIAPPLGITFPMFGPRQPQETAAACPKPKLALMGTHDQFCSASRFEAWASTLALPAEYEIVLGREVAGRPCCHDAHCGSELTRRLPVHHFNMFEHIERHLAPWVQSTFGVAELADLATSDGRTKGA